MSADHRDVLIDAHVHYHCGFSRRAFFDAARRNLDDAARRLELSGPHTRVLMLTESAGVDAFGRFAAEAARAATGDGGAAIGHAPNIAGATGGTDDATGVPTRGWSFRQTGEGNSLWAIADGDDSDGPGADAASAAHPSSRCARTRTRNSFGAAPRARILLVAGRQIVTRERLEVLALGCRAGVADGLPLRKARDAVLEVGGVPVVPWGFGKWWFSRGTELARLLETEASGRWFLGDNAGRPRLSRRPAMFREAAPHGIFVLPGSDPLPLPGQESKVGRCGLVMPRPLDAQRPAASLLAWLRARDEQPATFGRYEGWVRFGRDQLSMQLRKRGHDAVAAAGAVKTSGQPDKADEVKGRRTARPSRSARTATHGDSP